jgi:folate-binding protein YgfZ
VFSKVTFTELDTPLYGVTSGEILATLHENSTALVLPQGKKRAIVWGENVETNGSAKLWDLIDIQDGLPILFKANQFELIPQAANLQAIENAISFTKGCYIGQETAARLLRCLALPPFCHLQPLPRSYRFPHLNLPYIPNRKLLRHPQSQQKPQPLSL